MNSKGMIVPQEVAVAVSKRWPDIGPLWVAAVEPELVELCRRYEGRPVSVLAARYGFVVAVDAPVGTLVMRATPDPAGPDQATVSTALAELGVAPKVHESFSSDTGHWTVMDRVRPGMGVGNLRGSTLTAAALADVLRPLRDQSVPSIELPYLGDWLQSRLDDGELTDLAPGRAVAPSDERKRASSLLSELSKGAPKGLCHGDTSPGNLLSDDAKRLWWIDPRGVCGEVAYDIAVLALKTSMGHSPWRRMRNLAMEVGVDLDRVEAWATVALAARV